MQGDRTGMLPSHKPRITLSRAGQGLPLTTIVIAALVLIVLVVLVIIFAGQAGNFRQGLQECAGSCVASPDSCDDNAVGIYMKNCNGGGLNYCCPVTKDN